MKRISALLLAALLPLMASAQDKESASTVYFSRDITPQSLVAVFDATGWKGTGKVAVKMSTGEPPASNYLRPELVKDLVQKVGGTIVECNTAYGGARSTSVNHHKVAKEHGFTAIAPFDLLDETGEMAFPVKGQVLKQDYVGAKLANYNSTLVLSHFKGHAMAGYGGAIKNASIGFASSAGSFGYTQEDTQRHRGAAVHRRNFAMQWLMRPKRCPITLGTASALSTST